MTIEKPAITVLGPAIALVLRDGSGGKASPGGDGPGFEQNCSLGEIDD